MDWRTFTVVNAVLANSSLFGGRPLAPSHEPPLFSLITFHFYWNSADLATK